MFRALVTEADLERDSGCTREEPFRARGVHRKSHQGAIKSAVSRRFRRYVVPD